MHHPSSFCISFLKNENARVNFVCNIINIWSSHKRQQTFVSFCVSPSASYYTYFHTISHLSEWRWAWIHSLHNETHTFTLWIVMMSVDSLLLQWRLTHKSYVSHPSYIITITIEMSVDSLSLYVVITSPIRRWAWIHSRQHGIICIYITAYTFTK